MAYLLFRVVVVEAVWDVVVEVVEFQMGTLRLTPMVDHEFVLQTKNQWQALMEISSEICCAFAAIGMVMETSSVVNGLKMVGQDR
eukprot:14858094-Ditylum_brightwellii.AAC.1